MQTNVFPETYENQVHRRAGIREVEIEKESKIRIEAIEKTRPKDPKKRDYRSGSDWPVYLVMAVIFFGCCGMLGAYGIIVTMYTMLGLSFLVYVVCGIYSLVEKITYKPKLKKVDSLIAAEQNAAKNEIAKLMSDAEQEKLEYHKQFESDLKAMSVKFAESDLAKEVIEWMTKGFCGTIDAADREGYIEKIQAPFEFRVYEDKITCNLGTFDFKEKRCKFLESPLEQAALARAIATAVQLNIIMKYPKDPSGTEVSISISEKYSAAYNYVCTINTITYVAPNGYYKPERGW